ncbi:hypothetical protein ACIPJS_38265 [Streptomyces sp. NPDC086783]|uniref:hypothetical protein n=1 Tax=Streptomyces sp. NPDC086783 TaxID=3365758 RepID=UPI00382C11D9
MITTPRSGEMTQLHSQHNPLDSSNFDPSDDFENAVYTLANEPEEEDGITITREELALCGPVPLRLMVLMHWRVRQVEGDPCTPEAIWEQFIKQGILAEVGEGPVGLDEVRAAVTFVLEQGLVVAGSAR